jgi:hypothetical protein
VKYYVNRLTQDNGDHEVHTMRCNSMYSEEDRIPLFS